MEENMHGCLTDEIILYEILPRLPAKTLLRFKSVCKHWYKSISDPYFADIHLKASCSQSPRLIKTHQEITQLFMEKKQQYDLNPNEDIFANHLFARASSGNGLLLVSSRSSSNCLPYYYICNPITHQFIKLPSPPVSHDGTMEHYVYMFVFDDFIGKYKIIGLCSYIDYPDEGCSGTVSLTLGGGYSDGEESWRVSKMPLGIIESTKMFLLGRKLCWVSYSTETDQYVIVSMDITSEEIRQIELPMCQLYFSRWNFWLVEIKGFLYFKHPCRDQDDSYTIWILEDVEEGKWRKLNGPSCDCFNSNDGSTSIEQVSDLEEMEIKALNKWRSCYGRDEYIHHFDSLIDIRTAVLSRPTTSSASSAAAEYKVWYDENYYTTILY